MERPREDTELKNECVQVRSIRARASRKVTKEVCFWLPGQDNPAQITKRETALRDQWMEVIFIEHQRSCESVFVCSLHFKDACFTNKAQFDDGFAYRLFLKDDAIPTKKGHDHPNVFFIIINMDIKSATNKTLSAVSTNSDRKSANSLKAMIKSKNVVVRNGKEIEIDAEEITVGDIVVLSEGTKIPADMILLYDNNFFVIASSYKSIIIYFYNNIINIIK